MIRTELGSLQELKYLNLLGNKLSGVVPSELNLLNQLEKLDLSENNLSGSLNLSISKMKNLEVLILSDNHLTSGIPEKFCMNDSKLQNFSMNYRTLKTQR